MWWDAAADLISTGADFAATERTNVASAEEAAKQRTWAGTRQDIGMDYSAREAGISRNWQKEMSDTAYQRLVADLKAAGINPMLAVTKGGASTPTGATASAPGAPSGASAKMLKADSGKLIQAVKQLKLDTKYKEQIIKMDKARTEKEQWSAKSAKVDYKVKDINFAAAVQEAMNKLKRGKMRNRSMYFDEIMKRIPFMSKQIKYDKEK